MDVMKKKTNCNCGVEVMIWIVPFTIKKYWIGIGSTNYVGVDKNNDVISYKILRV